MSSRRVDEWMSEGTLYFVGQFFVRFWLPFLALPVLLFFVPFPALGTDEEALFNEKLAQSPSFPPCVSFFAHVAASTRAANIGDFSRLFIVV